eukprot:6174424-Pleurochrysis_carterae.AAC.1
MLVHSHEHAASHNFVLHARMHEHARLRACAPTRAGELSSQALKHFAEALRLDPGAISRSDPDVI